MIVYERPVRFEDVDAAGIVFFARFFSYCHEAMETLFDGIEGGYVALITKRKVGFPAVHVEADFRAPLRYGDVVRVAVDVMRVGTKSTTLRFTMTRGADGTSVAAVTHVCAVSDLVALKAVPIPEDVRAVLDAHRAS